MGCGDSRQVEELVQAQAELEAKLEGAKRE